MTSPKTEYKSKVTVDTGLTRGRIPCPLLRAIGARPGDYLIFRPVGKNEARVRVSRPGRKPAKAKSR